MPGASAFQGALTPEEVAKGWSSGLCEQADADVDDVGDQIAFLRRCLRGAKCSVGGPDDADHYAAAERSLAVRQIAAEAPTLSEHDFQRALGAIERDCLLEVSFSVSAEPAVEQAEAEPLEEECG